MRRKTSARALFIDERVALLKALTSGNGTTAYLAVDAGTPGRVVRERWHPVWRQCYVVRFDRDTSGRPVFAYVPHSLLRSLEQDRGANPAQDTP